MTMTTEHTMTYDALNDLTHAVAVQITNAAPMIGELDANELYSLNDLLTSYLVDRGVTSFTES